MCIKVKVFYLKVKKLLKKRVKKPHSNVFWGLIVYKCLTSVKLLNMFDPLEQFNIICAFKVRYCTFSSALLDNVSIIGFLNMVLLTGLLYFFSAFKAKGEITFKYFLVTVVTELNSVLKSNMFFKKQIFLGYLISLFSFILVSNVFGMVPYNVTVSSYFVLSFFFSAITFIGVTLVGIRYNRLRFLKVLLPEGVPHGM
jgi:F-type H+-transporting ATPase subunit a